jgi:hypothetical protein
MTFTAGQHGGGKDVVECFLVQPRELHVSVFEIGLLPFVACASRSGGEQERSSAKTETTESSSAPQTNQNAFNSFLQIHCPVKHIALERRNESNKEGIPLGMVGKKAQCDEMPQSRCGESRIRKPGLHSKDTLT